MEAIQHLNKKEVPPSTEMAAVVLILVLKTRTEQNISVDALKSYEESGDWTNFSLITKEIPKSIFDLIIKHYAKIIKSNHLK